MIWSNWYDLEEVAAIVNSKKDDKLIKLFTERPPSTEAFRDITNAFQDFNLLRKTAEQSLATDCGRYNKTYGDYLRNTRDLLQSRIYDMHYYQEPDIKRISQEVREGNYSWFLNHNEKISNQLRQWEWESCLNKVKFYEERKVNDWNQPFTHLAFDKVFNEVKYVSNIAEAEKILNYQLGWLQDNQMAYFDSRTNTLRITDRLDREVGQHLKHDKRGGCHCQPKGCPGCKEYLVTKGSKIWQIPIQTHKVHRLLQNLHYIGSVSASPVSAPLANPFTGQPQMSNIHL